MEFRLTYQGALLAESTDLKKKAARATHKHEIRKRLHPQLRRLWEITPFLKRALDGKGFANRFAHLTPEQTAPELAKKFAHSGYSFVPLITKDLLVGCSVDVLFLRSGPPGSVLSGGDIDNRMKTLFDALTMPREGQLGTYCAPDEGEVPFFCLLEDDCLITKAVVDTDTLLSPLKDKINSTDARVIIKIKTHLFHINHSNLGFV